MARKALETKTKNPRTTARKSSPVLPNNLNLSNVLKNKKALALLTLAIVLVLALLYVFKGLFVASLVNGEPISRISVIRALEKQSGKATLDNLVTKKLILQEARKRNVTVSQAEVDQELKKIEKSLKTQGSTLDQALELQGMTRNQLNNEIKIQLSIQKMVGKDIKVTDKEIADFITANKDQFPEGITEKQKHDEALTQLQQQKIQQKTQAFLADLQKKAKIQSFVSY